MKFALRLAAAPPAATGPSSPDGVGDRLEGLWGLHGPGAGAPGRMRRLPNFREGVFAFLEKAPPKFQ